MEAVELMHVITTREQQAAEEARVAQGRPRTDSPLQAMARRLTAKAKGHRRA